VTVREDAAAEGQAVGVRWPELIVALAADGAGAAGHRRQHPRVGTGWADDGPRSGYFPFYIGLAAAGLVGLDRSRSCGTGSATSTFAGRGQLRQRAGHAVADGVYVGLIALIGIYIASAVLIGYFMLRHGRTPGR
jgi:putative tricarboxylic transport membrane protein